MNSKLVNGKLGYSHNGIHSHNGILFSHKKEQWTLIHGTTWINLKSLIRSQTQRVTYCVIAFTEYVQNRQIRGVRKQISSYQGTERGM